MRYNELQGLRGLAIVAVVLYHLWPKIFYNGFLGVDVFFVLSGFLMAETQLKSLPTIYKFQQVPLFWYRRIHRIVPLSILNVLITWIIVTKKITVTNLKEITKESLCALSFTLNICKVQETKFYFDDIDLEYFKHYWSLAVEMQFYVIVPFLFVVFTRIPSKYVMFLVLPSFMVMSVLTQAYYFIIKQPQAGFSLLPCRLGQFCAGILAFYLRNLEFDDDGNDCCRRLTSKFVNLTRYYGITDVITVILGFILLVPTELDKAWMIVAVTMSTTVIITSLGTDKTVATNKNWVLKNYVLMILGEASFAIYVVHWIVLHCYSVISVDFELHESKLYCLYTIVAVGFGTHYFIEKPLLNAKILKSTFIKAVIVTYAVTLLTIYTTNDADAENEDFVMSFYIQDASKIADPDAWRRVSAFLDSKSSAQLAMHAGHVHCQFNPYSNWTQQSVPIFYGVELKGTGNKSYLIAGNSHAECVVPGIEAALGAENYKELNMVAIPALTPFPAFKDSFRLWQFKESVEHYKPDIILMTFKYQHDVIDLPIQYPIETDPVVTGIQSTMDFLSERVEKIFINGDHFQNEHTFNIWRYAQSAVLNVDKDLEFDQKYKQKLFANLHLRWQAVKCPKCILLDMWPAFCTSHKCSPLDPMKKVPLFWDDNHYTLFGSYKAMPVFRQYFMDANLISNKSNSNF